MLSKAPHRVAVASRLAAKIVRYGVPERLLYFGGGIGDDVLLTVPLRELARRNVSGTWVMTTHPIVYKGNKDVRAVVEWNGRYVQLARRAGITVRQLCYAPRDPVHDREDPPKQHIITMMCDQAGVRGAIERRPYLHFVEAGPLRKRLPRQYVTVQSTGRSAGSFMLNKEWYPERFTEVCRALCSEVAFVQIGSASDPAIPGSIDMRGKTSLQETAALISCSACYVGLVGLLMHVSRAVETRAVIIYGGRETPAQTGYSCNINIFRSPPCSPCWQWSACQHQRSCMSEITPGEVIAGVRQVLNERWSTLPTDRDVIA